MEEFEEENQMDHISQKALQMMQRMGYKTGFGLGKKQEGILEPIKLSVNLGTRGFGLKLQNLGITDEPWDFAQENISVEETIDWLENKDELDQNINENWIVKGSPKISIDHETNFCDPALLKKILLAKEVLDELDPIELCKARSRANPFETLKGAFFMNRAALKMANIDAVTNFMLTDIDRSPEHLKKRGPYYFADVCAGPGGFSEYVLWRKKWSFKGFGFTLRGEHDFQLSESTCASPVTFNAMYGVLDDGDICCPDNIRHFAEKVRKESEEKGVHFMMADGGFSVDGNENLQEVLSKQLYVCQCLMALEIVRPHGHFVTKVFDLFTPFSAGLVYLMQKCFKKLAILKPNSSRPANSERYLICVDLQENPDFGKVKQHLWKIATELFNLRQIQMNFSLDINEIVPLPLMMKDSNFINYITGSNNRIGSYQLVGLSKLVSFCRNPTLIEGRQEELRAKCLKYWRIPDHAKVPQQRFTTDDLLSLAVSDPDFLFSKLKQVYCEDELMSLISDVNEWHYSLCESSNKKKYCNFYAGVGGSRVYRLQRYKWVRVKNLQLVCGTLLFGELVREHVQPGGYFNYEKPAFKQSLHVIDALRLGDTSLADLPFKERLDLIDTYCQAVNHESRTGGIRVRCKPVYPLIRLSQSQLRLNSQRGYILELPVLGYNNIKEYFIVNSILLHSFNEDSFDVMHTTRIQVYLKNEHEEQSQKDGIPLRSLCEFVEKKN